MRCPYCLENFNAIESRTELFNGTLDLSRTTYYVATVTCSNQKCKKRIIFLDTKHHPAQPMTAPGVVALTSVSTTRKMILPKTEARPGVVSADIPEKYLTDYQEAVDVLPTSAKASAALSRRILQITLRDEALVSHSNLYSEIGSVLDTGNLPSRVAVMLDAVREVGNFAAHVTKSTNSGEIVDVEPGEAELNLEVIEMLFDHYFTAPRLAQQRIDLVNAKLVEAGKKTIEQTIVERQETIDRKKQ